MANDNVVILHLPSQLRSTDPGGRLGVEGMGARGNGEFLEAGEQRHVNELVNALAVIDEGGDPQLPGHLIGDHRPQR